MRDPFLLVGRYATVAQLRDKVRSNIIMAHCHWLCTCIRLITLAIVRLEPGEGASYRLGCHNAAGGALAQDATGQTANKERRTLRCVLLYSWCLVGHHACRGTRHTGGGRWKQRARWGAHTHAYPTPRHRSGLDDRWPRDTEQINTHGQTIPGRLQPNCSG